MVRGISYEPLKQGRSELEGKARIEGVVEGSWPRVSSRERIENQTRDRCICMRAGSTVS